MKYTFFSKIFVSILVLTLTCIACNDKTGEPESKTPLTKVDSTQLTYLLPSPNLSGNVSLEEAIVSRRSHRNYHDKALTPEEISQVLWAAYGITKVRTDRDYLRGGYRTAPSAGARYPLDVYILIGKVKGVEPGVYKYISAGHKIVRTIEEDRREALSVAALNQEMIHEAPVALFYTAIYSRCTDKYGARGRERYVCMDLGHSAQNVYLQVEAMGLGTCAIGAFNDETVVELLELPEDEEPLYIMPVGYYYEE